MLFASEVRALLASGLVPRRLDPAALGQFLAYQSVPAPRTLVAGVEMLDAGRWTASTRGTRPRRRRYWDLAGLGRERRPLTDRGRAPRCRSCCRIAALHLVSDVPVGVFLSGGIDSIARSSR